MNGKMEEKIFVSVVQMAKVKLTYLGHVYYTPFTVICDKTICAKERIFSVPKCCSTLLVEGGGDPMEKQPGLYHSYALESDLLNGHVHYTSQDKTMAMAYNAENKVWYIQEAEKR